MPFYTFRNGDEYIEEMFSINNIPDEIERDGKIFTYVPTFSTNFILRGVGWAGKGTALASSPKRGREIGLKVDHERKAAMKAAGEKV